MGSNPDAAKYARIKLGRITVLSMALSGTFFIQHNGQSFRVCRIERRVYAYTGFFGYITIEKFHSEISINLFFLGNQ